MVILSASRTMPSSTRSRPGCGRLAEGRLRCDAVRHAARDRPRGSPARLERFARRRRGAGATARELEILRLTAEGYSAPDIAGQLALSTATSRRTSSTPAKPECPSARPPSRPPSGAVCCAEGGGPPGLSRSAQPGSPHRSSDGTIDPGDAARQAWPVRRFPRAPIPTPERDRRGTHRGGVELRFSDYVSVATAIAGDHERGRDAVQDAFARAIAGCLASAGMARSRPGCGGR